jgi:hypothetical protein
MRFGWHTVAQLAFAVIGCCTSACSTDGGGGASAQPSVLVPPCQPVLLFSSPEIPDPHVRETHSGLNGEFTDTCENGDLVQYECETRTIAGPPTDPAYYTSVTGQVVSTNVDCGGRCTNGACPDTCPAEGDRLRCVSVAADGHTTLKSISSGWTYECDINSLAGCQTMPQPGDTVDVTSKPANITSRECVADTDLGYSVGTGTQPSCWYHPCIPTPP